MAVKEKVIPVFQTHFTTAGHELTKDMYTERYDIRLDGILCLSCLTVGEAQYWAHNKGFEFRPKEATKVVAAENAEHAVSGN
jgi:hypothetical protein